MKKTLKFAGYLADMIMRGEKTCAWRSFDDKDIQKGDRLEFFNRDAGVFFGVGTVESVHIKRFKDINDEDFVGHEKFKNKEEMLKTYQGFYGDKVNWDTDVKVIRFSFNPAS